MKCHKAADRMSRRIACAREVIQGPPTPRTWRLHARNRWRPHGWPSIWAKTMNTARKYDRVRMSARGVRLCQVSALDLAVKLTRGRELLSGVEYAISRMRDVINGSAERRELWTLPPYLWSTYDSAPDRFAPLVAMRAVDTVMDPRGAWKNLQHIRWCAVHGWRPNIAAVRTTQVHP